MTPATLRVFAAAPAGNASLKQAPKPSAPVKAAQQPKQPAKPSQVRCWPRQSVVAVRWQSATCFTHASHVSTANKHWLDDLQGAGKQNATPQPPVWESHTAEYDV